MTYIPERGDVVWINFDPQMGHEQAGRRPAVVLSDQIKNIDWRARQATYLCALPPVVVEAVRNKVRSLV